MRPQVWHLTVLPVVVIALVCAKTIGLVKGIGTQYSRCMDKETLRTLGRALTRAKGRQQQAHEALVDAIWEAADQGMQQVDIVAAVGLTRERVRQLCDAQYREDERERRAKRTANR